MKRFAVIIVGVLFIGISVFMYFKNSYLVKNCTVEVKATVVDMKQELSTDEDGTDYIYYPIIEYKASENTIRVTMDSGSNTHAYDIDEKITILYNPKKPKEFIVKGDNTLNIFSIVFMVLGLFVTGCGIKIALKKD